MKYILILMVFLSGCSMSYEEVSKLEGKCKSLGGVPSINANGGEVYWVHCQIDGVLYREGKY